MEILACSAFCFTAFKIFLSHSDSNPIGNHWDLRSSSLFLIGLIFHEIEVLNEFGVLGVSPLTRWLCLHTNIWFFDRQIFQLAPEIEILFIKT
jgi:hypothetical protein